LCDPAALVGGTRRGVPPHWGRLVGATARGMVANPAGVPRARRDRALVMRIDVVDVHADVMARDAGAHRAPGAVGALRAEPDHAVAEFNHGMADHSPLAHASRSRDLAEAERTLQELPRSADVLI